VHSQNYQAAALLCTIAVDNKLLVALNAISSQQAKAMVHTEQLVEMLLNHGVTYSNKGIVYRASDMVLCTHADAGYLNETKSHSRANGWIYFETCCGCYGLPQAGILANNLLCG
jgi:hypothetical protein